MERTRASPGFSLLELIIGVLIMAILAAVALPSFSKAIEKTKVKNAQTILAALYSAEKIYRLDQGSYAAASNLVAGNYITDPNPANPTDADWTFAAAPGGGDATFSATATRAMQGPNPGATVQVDERFTGESNPAYGGKVYDGNHPLRD